MSLNGAGGIRTPGAFRHNGFQDRGVKTDNGLPSKDLQQRSPDDLALRLALIVRHHPELTTLIEAWPDATPEVRAAILRMISDGGAG